LKEGEASASPLPMKQKLNNILIAVNTYDGHQYCREDFVKNLKEIQKYSGADVAIFYNGRQMPWGFDGWPIVYYEPSEFDNGISILCAKNNQMRDYFLNGKWSHMLMLESDIIPPIDVVNRLYSYHKDTVTAMYFIKTLMKDMVNMPIESTWNVLDNETMQTKIITIPKGDNIMVIAQKFIPAIWGFFDGKSRIWEMEDAFPQRGLVRIYSAGIGCVLMKRIVLEKCGNFEIRDISEEIQNFTDFLYFKKIHDNGFQAFVDTNTICKHEHYDFDSFVKRRWFDTKTMKPVNDPKI
jgi:hypothetical protein